MKIDKSKLHIGIWYTDPELYEPQYKDEIERLSYTEGLLYMARRSLEKGKSNV